MVGDCCAGRVAIALALIAALAVPATAERRGVVVVATARAPITVDDAARAVARGLGGAADAAVEVDAVAAARRARAGGAVPAGRLRGFARVAQLAAEGWRAYLAVDGEFAAARLVAARAEAEELVVLDGGLEVYADVALRLGLVLTALGRTDEGGDVLRLAHALDPGRTPGASEFSPDAVAAYDAAVARVPARRLVELAVPTGTTVAIDGRELGGAPATLELAVGQHVVVARASGRLARGQAVSIPGPGAGPVRLELRLDPDPAAILDDDDRLAVGSGADRAGPMVSQVLLHAELDALYLVASVHRGGAPALLGQRCTEARPACTEVIEIGYVDRDGLDAAARLLLDRLTGARLRDGATLPSDPRLRGGPGPGPGGDGDGRRRWLYAGVGIAAVAAIVTAVAIASEDDAQPIVTIDPGDFGL